MLPALVAVAAMPLLVQGLGVARFGILALVWAIAGYLSLFDLGIGRAVTKLAGESYGAADPSETAALAWTGAVLQFGLGLLAALLLWLLAPALARDVLRVPDALVPEARSTFRMLALSIPPALVGYSFRGALEAMQRFDLVAAVRVPVSTGIFLIPAAGVALGLGLPSIVLLLAALRLAGLLGYAGLLERALPGVTRRYRFGRPELLRLAGFGGWIALSSLLIPSVVYLDRFLIGSLLSVDDVGFYSAPYEVVSRGLVVPGAIAAVFFPAFSSFAARGRAGAVGRAVSRTTTVILFLMTPAVVLGVIFAPELLDVWLGAGFRERSALVFRLLAVAVLLNSLAVVPAAMVEGVGRPDIMAKYHLAELPVYVLVAALLISRLGIEGAALAWCLRMVWTLPIFMALTLRAAHLSVATLLDRRTLAAVALSGGVLGCAIAIAAIAPAAAWKAAAAALLLGPYALLLWTRAILPEERLALGAALSRLLPRSREGE